MISRDRARCPLSHHHYSIDGEKENENSPVFICFLLTLLLTGLFCVPQASAVDLPQVNAKAALLMDYESGRTLYGLNERDTEYPASITKVMTALLTLEAVDRGC